MKLVVFPEARRAQVAAALAAEFEHRGGTENLILTITRLRGRWSVHATGLGDPVLEQGFRDLVQHTLKHAGLG